MSLRSFKFLESSLPRDMFHLGPKDLKRAARAPKEEEFWLHFGARARRVFKPVRNFLEDSCYELPRDMFPC